MFRLQESQPWTELQISGPSQFPVTPKATPRCLASPGRSADGILCPAAIDPGVMLHSDCEYRYCASSVVDVRRHDSWSQVRESKKR